MFVENVGECVKNDPGRALRKDESCQDGPGKGRSFPGEGRREEQRPSGGPLQEEDAWAFHLDALPNLST